MGRRAAEELIFGNGAGPQWETRGVLFGLDGGNAPLFLRHRAISIRFDHQALGQHCQRVSGSRPEATVVLTGSPNLEERAIIQGLFGEREGGFDWSVYLNWVFRSHEAAKHGENHVSTGRVNVHVDRIVLMGFVASALWDARLDDNKHIQDLRKLVEAPKQGIERTDPQERVQVFMQTAIAHELDHAFKTPQEMDLMRKAHMPKLRWRERAARGYSWVGWSLMAAILLSPEVGSQDSWLPLLSASLLGLAYSENALRSYWQQWKNGRYPDYDVAWEEVSARRAADEAPRFLEVNFEGDPKFWQGFYESLVTTFSKSQQYPETMGMVLKRLVNRYVINP